MHSENIDDQNNAVNYFQATAIAANIRFAKHHQHIIKQYGRFPYRNTILGRKNSTAENAYLNAENAFLG